MDKENWIKHNLQIGGNEPVIRFIAAIIFHSKDESDAIPTLFSAGYCYYFAVILKEAFKRGSICQAWPFSHIVWVDEDDTPYDIYGVNQGEYVELVPVDRYGESLNAFRHVPGEYIPTEKTQKETVNAIRAQCTLSANGIRRYKNL